VITSLALVALALAFAWSMGAHYTGACMGMPYAMGALSRQAALGLMAVLVFLGASLFSHAALERIGTGIVGAELHKVDAALVLAVAFGLTTLFTRLRIPTSTIQIFVAALVGAGLALGLAVAWWHVLALILLWIAAPAIGFALGWGGTLLLDQVWRTAMRFGDPARLGRGLLALGGMAASLAMGANDVANATAVFRTTGFGSVWLAALLGGAGLAFGVLTWGRPLLERVAFQVVTMDLPMAIAAKFAQALIVLIAVSFGAFTSMNQALIGAMAGAGTARGGAIDRTALAGILRGWVVGPMAGLALGFAMVQLRLILVLRVG
jgi:PiT family inorganic phosphate transporter